MSGQKAGDQTLLSQFSGISDILSYHQNMLTCLSSHPHHRSQFFILENMIPLITQTSIYSIRTHHLWPATLEKWNRQSSAIVEGFTFLRLEILSLAGLMGAVGLRSSVNSSGTEDHFGFRYLWASFRCRQRRLGAEFYSLFLYLSSLAHPAIAVVIYGVLALCHTLAPSVKCQRDRREYKSPF